MTEEGVLISIRPHWTELIINQHKRIEIRKNLPHLAVPFTVYVYCTLNGQEKWLAGIKGKYPPQKLNGYVVAEFTCDSIETLPYDTFYDWCNRIAKEGFIAVDKLWAYANGKTLYAWHISDLKAYVHPLRIEDFNYANCMDHLNRPPQSLVYVDNPHKRCVNCDYRDEHYCNHESRRFYMHYTDIFMNSCPNWKLSTKGCYACDSEGIFREIRR